MPEVIAAVLRRMLQQQFDSSNTDISMNDDDSPTFVPGPPMDVDTTNNGDGGVDRGAYEFVAFVLWYLFLVLCCIVPTCCAYRRRRILEARYSNYHGQQAAFTLEQLQQLQQAQQQLSQHSGLLFLPASLQHRHDLFRNTQDLVDSDAAKEERTRRLEEVLRGTTFAVKVEDIVEGDGDLAPMTAVSLKGGGDDSDDVDDSNNNQLKEEHKNENTATLATASLHDMEALALADLEITSVLRLPIEIATVNDTENDIKHTDVPAVCAICLCGYEPGDYVTYSKQAGCKHAFHKECIVPWLAKTNDGSPRCPCCRQVYCHIQPITFADLMNVSSEINNANNTENTAIRTTSMATTLTPFEFMMAVRSGGSSLFFPQEFQMQSANTNPNVSADNNNDGNSQHIHNDDVEQGIESDSIETTEGGQG